jgi:hypothetical protein
LKEAGKKQATPIVANGLAVYAIGHHVYGFSASTRAWDVLTLPEDAKPAVITTSNRATVEYGDIVYLFNGKSGKWTSFNARTGQAGGSEGK